MHNIHLVTGQEDTDTALVRLADIAAMAGTTALFRLEDVTTWIA